MIAPELIAVGMQAQAFRKQRLTPSSRSCAGSGRVEAGARHRIALTLLVLLGGGLRILNTVTALVHPDEKWAIVAIGVVLALVSPATYLQGLTHPSDPYLQLRFQPLTFVAGNLAALAQPSTWYYVRLDEQPAIVHGVAPGPLTVGRFPRVTLSTPSSTKVREIIIRPAPGGSSHP
jgi:hypothetical protein